MVKLKINGREINGAPGSTVLEAAQAQGIRIPNLCAFKGLTPVGGCRLCLVEVKGKRGYLPACTTAVEEGLEVITDTPRLQAHRRQTLELILSEHPHACLICSEKTDCEEYKSTIRKVEEVTGCVLCSENGRCELQDVVTELKVERVRWPAIYRNFEVRREDPFFDRNYNLCILCTRCVRVCSEVRGAAAISVVFRGPQAAIGTSLDRPLLESGCQFCGACVDVCPTGALAERGLKGEGLTEAKGETVCPLCSLGCALEADLKKGRIVSTRPKADALVNRGQACVKGRFIVRDVVHAPERIKRPLIRRGGELVEASWDEALEIVARELKGRADKAPAMVVSSQMTLEDLYIAQKLGRSVLSAELALDLAQTSLSSLFLEELREQKISLPLNFESHALTSAQTILVAGADLTMSHPILWLDILRAVGQGARLVAWNAGGASLIRRATLELRTKAGTELAALCLLSRYLMDTKSADKWAEVPGRDELKASLETRIQALPGVPDGPAKDSFLSAARLLGGPGPVVFLIGPGLVRGPDARRIVQMVLNLALLSDASVIPLAFEINERAALALLPPEPPAGRGRERIIEGLNKGRHRTLYLAGHLPGLGQSILPDFLVVQGCFQSAADEFAQVILPSPTWAETDGTFVNAEGRIIRFKKLIDPLGEARPDWWIFSRLAEKMGSRDFPFQNAAEIAEEMSQAIPSLHQASAHHIKKGRAAFVSEDEPSSVRFIPFHSAAGTPARFGEESSSAPAANIPDYYRGLDLRKAVRALRKLRERDIAPDKSQVE